MASDVTNDVKKIFEIVQRFRDYSWFEVTEEQWNKAELKYEGALVFKVSSGEEMKAGLMMDMFRKPWNLKEKEDRVTFDNICPKTVIVKFTDEELRTRVINGGPWSYKGMAILMDKWRIGTLPEEYNSRTINVWVQVFNIPYEFRDELSAIQAASKIGEVIMATDQIHYSVINGIKREYLRVKVKVNVDVPLRKGTFMMRKGRSPIWITFRYEKLPKICPYCGVLTHEKATCPKKFISTTEEIYTASMKAEKGLFYEGPVELQAQLSELTASMAIQREREMIPIQPRNADRRMNEQKAVEEQQLVPVGNCNDDEGHTQEFRMVHETDFTHVDSHHGVQASSPQSNVYNDDLQMYEERQIEDLTSECVRDQERRRREKGKQVVGSCIPATCQPGVNPQMIDALMEDGGKNEYEDYLLDGPDPTKIILLFGADWEAEANHLRAAGRELCGISWMAEKPQPVKVLYCQVCSLPAEYCEFGPDFEKCKPWLIQNAPQLYPDLVKGLEGKEGDQLANQLQSTTISADGSGATPSGTAVKQEEVKRLPGGKIKKKDKPEVIIEKSIRNRRKCITSVKGLDLFGVKLSYASKKLRKKFATGASVVKGPTEKEHIDVQGDIAYDVVEFITDTWPDVPEAAICLIEDGKKVLAA
ncbi:unnamed protein product [Rhodiola kirilowii]